MASASLMLAASAHASITLINGDFSNTGTPAPSWSNLSGSSQAWGNNETLVDAGNSTAAWMVEQITSSTLTANTTYEFSVDTGNNTSSGGSTGQWTATIGTWDGATFTQIATQSWTGIKSTDSFTQGTEETRTFQFSTGAASLSDAVAVRLSVDGGSGWMAMDNVSITVIPEPSAAALLGLGGFALILHRRK